MNRLLTRSLLGAVALVATLFLLIWIDDIVYRLAGDSTIFWRVAVVAAILWGLTRKNLLNPAYILLAIVVCLAGPQRLIADTWPVSLPLLAVTILQHMYTRLQSRLRPAAIGLGMALILILVFEQWGASSSPVWMAEKQARAVSDAVIAWLPFAWLAFAALLLLPWRATAVLILIAAFTVPGAFRIRQIAATTLRTRQTSFVAAWTREQKSTIEATIAIQAKTAWEMDSPTDRQSIEQFARQLNHLGPASDRVLKSITDWQTLEGDWSGPPARLRAELALTTSGITGKPGNLDEARREARALAIEEQRAQEAEQRADEAWRKAGEVFGSEQPTEFLRGLAKNWADKAFWAGVKPRLDRSRWTPALWSPGLYDAATGTSPLLTQANREIEKERGE
jgi:hypothetical protein